MTVTTAPLTTRGDGGQRAALHRFRVSGRPRVWLLQAIPFAVLLPLWQLTAERIDDDTIVPGPARVADAAAELVTRGILPAAAQSSFTTLLIGTGITVAVVLPLAILLALNTTAAGLIQPMVRFISNVPAIALIPLFIVWLGFTEKAVYATLVYTAAIPLLFSAMTGVQKIPQVYVNGLKPLGAGTLHTIRAVYLPGATPGIVVGIRLAFSYGWRSVVAGELIIGSGGLGELLSRARSTNQIDEIVAVMIVISILFLVIDRLFLFPWEQIVAGRWSSL
ncbi:ABC transporter permease [Kribbella sp. NPDC050124]|uniref:ABC transporter permease n=1 Tax=Kribbella sp. NPDC050124 TaxID=3364114 RepID=UPI0037B8B18A